MKATEEQAVRFSARAGGMAEGSDPVIYDFSDALTWAKSGKRIARSGWICEGRFVWMASVGAIQPDSNDSRDMTFIDTLMQRDAKDKLTTWLPSMEDLAATDWEVFREPALSDLQQQALEELEQLSEKLTSLTAFIEDQGSTFSSLSFEEQHQMRMKASYMGDYARALQRVADGLGGAGGAA